MKGVSIKRYVTEAEELLLVTLMSEYCQGRLSMMVSKKKTLDREMLLILETTVETC